MPNYSKIKEVVDNNMCIGCGLCAVQSKNDSIKMQMNSSGFYTANVIDESELHDDCIKVCPFNPKPNDEVKTENEISDIFLNQASKRNIKIGRYINTYVGHSVSNRLTSSSGGIATYTLTELMKLGHIQHVISVKNGNENSGFYQYAISSNVSDLKNGSKTRYYPVTLSDAMEKIRELDGKIAIVGVACFIKAIRLAQIQEPLFNSKIKFLVGIICGGVKSTYFSEYLANKAGVSVNEYSNPEFRIKDENSTASDYSYGCLDKENNQHTIKMRTVGDMWGTGLFKANACDYCDDVTAELADLSLGDAWLEPYNQDGLGANVIVSRSNLAEEIILKGIESGQLKVNDLAIESLIKSQQGSFNHRHDGLSYRVKSGKTDVNAIPPKRFDDKKIDFLSSIVHSLRMNIREKSIVEWSKDKDSKYFDSKMANILFLLKVFTKLNHIKRRLTKSN